MATRNQVLSLFGATPEQVRQRQLQEQQQSILSQRDPYARAGTAIGVGLSRLFGGKSEAEQQAEQIQQIQAGANLDTPEGMRQTAERLSQAGFGDRALQLMTLAENAEIRSMKKEATGYELQQARADAEQIGKPKPIAPNVYSALVEKHGVTNTNRFIETRNLEDLGPVLSDSEQKAISSYGKELTDAGYEPGTPAFEDQMQVMLQKELDTMGTQKVVTAMNPFEQKQFISDTVTSDPRYTAASEMETKIDKARGLLPQAKKGVGEATTLLQRTISDLYNSDTRAASEIDRLVRSNRSLARTFEDAVSGALFGELSDDTISNLQTIMNVGTQTVSTAKQSVVENKLSLYGDDIDADVQKTLSNSLAPQLSDPLNLR